MARKLWLFSFSVFVLWLDFAFGHSEMRCAKYDPATGDCSAAIRNEIVAFQEEAYQPSTGDQGICQTAWANPITAFYSNGSLCPAYAGCPDPMGSFTQGETFTIMWWARNHAIADEDPDSVFLYLSPLENANQGSDTPEATFLTNQICSGPYSNCSGQNGDTVPCTLTCTMPSSLQNGIYTLYWKWPWQGTVYTTCADINVVSSLASSSSSSGSSHATTGKVAPATTGKAAPVTTGKASAVTTGKASAVTTGKESPVTTSKASAVTTGKESPVTTSKASPVTTSKASPVTTAKGTSSSTSSSSSSTSGKSTTGSSDSMCYLPGTPNLNGTILSNPPYCGKNAKKARCADGQCCSKYGYCGPIADSNGNYFEDIDGIYQQVTYDVAVSLYCGKGNQGDYRKVSCSSLNNKDDTSVTDAGVSIKFNFFLLLSSICFVALWNRFSL